MTMPVVTFTGRSLTTISDEDLLHLLLRDDLPGYLTELYTGEADRRLGTRAQYEVAG